MVWNTIRARGPKAISLLAFLVITFFVSAVSQAQPTVPVYNSRPGATAQLFLDFDGVDFGNLVWGSDGQQPGLRPAYSINADTTTFTTTELNNIFEIWSRVAEAYSPFNINVTTVNPGNYNQYQSAHVVISGNNSWYGSAGGVAKGGGFTDFTFSNDNAKVRRTSWVFPGNLNNGNPKTVADAAIHEAGHMFDLDHQPTFNSSGAIVDQYDTGTSLRAPTLGVAYGAQRGLWSIGPDNNGSPNNDTNEMSVIGSTSTFANGFGFVPDETGTSTANAPVINLSSTALRGVIGNVTSSVRSNDVDYYRINLNSASQVTINVDVAQFGPMLDSKLLLLDSQGTTFYTNDPTLTSARSTLQSSFNGLLAAGTYYLGITSHGGFSYSLGSGASDRFLEDTGQYFITGSIVAVPEPSLIALGVGLVGLVALRRRCLAS